MKIAIEAERANSKEKTGVENYAKQLILNLAKIDFHNTYILYLRTEPENWFLDLPKNFIIKVMPFPVFWTQIRLSIELFLNPVDALLILASALPFYHPKNSVVTIHDTAWKFYPETFGFFTRLFLSWSTKFAVKNAKKVIAVSESTKNDLIKLYSLEKDKIFVIHHGFTNETPNSFSVLPSELENMLPEKYIMFFSTIQPRKNLDGLIESFIKLKKQLPQLPHKLVVVGKLGWKFKDVLKKMQKNKNLVVYMNYLEDKYVRVVLKKATAMILPSFYEGFGMTILEAFATNIPVLTSNVSSMPEVAGSAALYFDPKNPESIQVALKTVLTNPIIREDLVKKGQEQLKNFSWEKSAKQTLQVLLK